MAKEASFDIVSNADVQEVINAVHQAQKELQTRFDFKGSKSEINMSDEDIVVVSDDEYKLTSVIDILQSKLIKRGISLKSLDYQVVESASKGTVRQTIRIKQGLEQDVAKKIVKIIKDSKLKVQATLQGDQVRVTGKSRDDLQMVIQTLKDEDLAADLQYVNYR